MDEIIKKMVGRPYKMQAWVLALTEVLDNEDILFLSDDDLVFLVNHRLSEESQISKSTFEKWKSGKYAPNEEVGKDFVKCIQLALIKQKQMLSKKMMEDNNGQWTRYAWIMERKFTEWNLKHISENINKNEQSTVINITAGSDEQKKLIDNIINATFEEIPFKELATKKEQNNNEKEDYEPPF